MKRLFAIVLCLLFLGTPAQACIWDRDTLAMERARFPEVNELIVGYFPRHSSAYYQWRKEQVLAIALDQRTAADYDDLGASYDKLGQHDKAIATMLAKAERFPNDGVYETHANLGTFYIHNGDLEQGAQYIGSAIEINPDAHFGREVYQKLLVEYVLATRINESTTTQDGNFISDLRHEATDFATYVFKRQGIEGDYEAQTLEADRAIKGVLGMMRFGNYDSPVLLEALGDLLIQSESMDGPQRLAARAYLKASYAPVEAHKADLLRGKAGRALQSQENVSLDRVEANLKKEIDEGDAYFAKIEADEKAWIAAGKDVDKLFIENYYNNDATELSQSLLSKATDRFNSYREYEQIFIVALVIGAICFVSLIVIVLRVRRLRERRREIAAKLQQA